MTRPIGQVFRGWLPALFGVLAVLAASVYVVARQSAVREGITELRQLSDRLSEAAAIAQSTVLTSEKVALADARREELEQRIREAHMPGLIQAGLMDSAREANLNVREIQPAHAAQQRGDNGAAAFPSYRVRVSGTYQQIADFMQICKTQRLPARVTAFHMTNETNQEGEAVLYSATREGTPRQILAAEITVEVFQLPHSAIKLVKG